MGELTKLTNGYREFYQEYFVNHRAHYEDLVREGQEPKAIIISCSDSRVDPSIITKASPGELFTIRNIANLVPPCFEDPTHHSTAAGLEFAVCQLKVEHIIILGHTHCGGIQAVVDQYRPQQHPSFIPAWMEIAEKPCNDALADNADLKGEARYRLCEQASMKNSLTNLETYPWIKDKIDAGKLACHAWYFDLDSGAIKTYNKSENEFIPL